MKIDEYIVGLDIGSSKVSAIIGQMLPEKDGLLSNSVKILAVSRVPTLGVKKGAIVNIDATVEAIQKAVSEAELMAGLKISKVVVSMSGVHINSMNSSGVVGVKGKGIAKDDIERVIDAARAVAIPGDRSVLHVIPQEFKVDDQDGIQDPLGMMGVRLEAKIHIVTALKSSIQNIIRCCHMRGLQVAALVFSPLASAQAVLSRDEKELGVALVDIGAGTSDVVIYQHGSVVHSAVVPLGGFHVSQDLAIGLRTPQTEAERIKITKGCATKSLVEGNETVEVPSVGGRPPRIVERRLLAEIIEPRMEEILQLVNREIISSGCAETLGGGVVLTGGGTMLAGVSDLAEMVFDLPVKVGVPQGMTGFADIVSAPVYATAVGLIHWGGQEKAAISRMSIGHSETIKKIRDKVGGWIDQMF